MLQSLGWAALGTGFTFLMTALGAAMVFFFAGEPRPHFQKTLLGFAAGVMTAASVWSLLLPAIDRAAEGALPDWLPAAGGMLLGVVFLSALDALLPHLRRDRTWQDASWRQTTLLMTAITLHNVPEGMAVGLAFALVSGGEGFAGAAALAMGIGIQNFPEGAAVALPLRQGGWSRPRAFVGGMLSGAVEPVFGVLAALAAAGVDPLMKRFFLEEKKGGMLPRVAPELSMDTYWYYKNAHTIDQKWSVRACGVRQRHIDQAQSVNLYITNEYTLRQVLELYVLAWECGVKTVYYVRSKSLEVEECESCSS